MNNDKLPRDNYKVEWDNYRAGCNNYKVGSNNYKVGCDNYKVECNNYRAGIGNQKKSGVVVVPTYLMSLSNAMIAKNTIDSNTSPTVKPAPLPKFLEMPWQTMI